MILFKRENKVERNKYTGVCLCNKKMALSTKFVRAQLSVLKPLLTQMTIEKSRTAQDIIGNIMAGILDKKTVHIPCPFARFEGEHILPLDKKREGLIFYLHGGGYTAGSIKYARGFASVLAARNGMETFCAAYRLAPEHPYPAALEDALEAYEYLLKKDYGQQNIILCGESAGGGLIYALAQAIKRERLTMPKGMIAISPWMDLTLSGRSLEENRETDPSLSRQSLECFTAAYLPNGQSPEDPLVSPLFGNFVDFPPSVLFAGGAEILLDDAVRMQKVLISYGNKVTLFIQKNMWHAYVLYGIKEAREDLSRINKFIRRLY